MTLASLAMIASACSDDKSTAPVPDPEDPRKSIAGVMQELIDAYEARDLDRYSRLFDRNNFEFVFDPVDVTTDPDIPPSWDWSEEESSAENLFMAALVETIELEFAVQTPVDASEEDTGNWPFPEGTKKVVATNVKLMIDTRDPAGGENIVYNVDGDHAIFFIYQDTLDVVEGVPAWKIFEWRDQRIGALAVEIKSWGGVKNLFQ